MHIPIPIYFSSFLNSTPCYNLPWDNFCMPITSKKTFSQVFLGKKYVAQHQGERAVSCGGKVDLCFILLHMTFLYKRHHPVGTELLCRTDSTSSSLFCSDNFFLGLMIVFPQKVFSNVSALWISCF